MWRRAKESMSILLSRVCIADATERRSAFKHVTEPKQFPRDKTRNLGHKGRMFRFSTAVLTLFLCATTLRANPFQNDRIIVSIRDQKLMLVQDGGRIATYPVSTSKFGIGDNLGRMTTPLGFLQVAQKIGGKAPSGAVFHNRRWTGEVLRPNAPGRDPIVTRIIWLRGLEAANAHAYSRCIYIHGTPQEQMIGRPASYGCIRMRSSDVEALYNQVSIGTLVQIIPDRLPKLRKGSPQSTTLMASVNKTAPAAAEAWAASAVVPKKVAPESKGVVVTLAVLASAPTHLRSATGE